MAGERGPIGKRTEERRRRNKPATPVDRVAVGGEIDDLFGDDPYDEKVEHRYEIDAVDEDFVPPPADENWHPYAVEQYDALLRSGQRIFFQPSDWAQARLLCEGLSRDLKPQWVNVGSREEPQMEEIDQPLKGANIAAYLKGFSNLGMTEGDRRRLSIELTNPTPGASKPLPEGVTDINEGRREALG